MFEEGFYRKFRQEIPDRFFKWIDRYSYESAELQNLIQSNNKPLTVISLDLSLATSSKIINLAGRGFSLYGYVTGDATKTVVKDFLVNVRLNQDVAQNEYPGKHQRGFRGDFFRLYLNWPAQVNVSVDLVIHNFDDRPYQGGIEAT